MNRKITISLLVLMVLFPLLVITMLPYGVVYFIKDRLALYGVKHVAIENIDLNIFTGEFALKRLEAINSDNRMLVINSASMEFSVDFLDKKIKLEDAALSGVDLHMQKTGDGYTFFLDELNNASRHRDKENEIGVTYASNVKDGSSVWSFAVDNFDLQDVRVSVADIQAKSKLALAFNLDSQSILVNTLGDISIGSLKMRDVNLLVNEKPVLAYDDLNVEAVGFSNNFLNINNVILGGVLVQVLRLKNGDLHALSVFDAFVDKPAANVGPAVSGRVEPIVWSVGGFSIDGNNRIHIVDEMVAPVLDASFTVASLDIGALDSRTPEKGTAFKLVAAADEYSRIVMDGEARPLLPDLWIEMQGVIEKLDITPYSPYVNKVIGYDIKTGQLNLNAKLSIKDKILESNNELRINKFSVAIADKEKAKEFEDGLNLSLDSALYFIRDDNDDVRLMVPVAGSIDDPEFDLSSVIRKASGKALKGATTTYLKFALQPWGALFMIGEKLGEKAGSIRFEPVVFAAGEAELQDDMQAYLARLSGLLAKKKKLRLSLCPVTTEADRLALQSSNIKQAMLPERLVGLADQRALVVKNHFVQAQGVDPERLFVCPASQDDKDKTPRVIIEM